MYKNFQLILADLTVAESAGYHWKFHWPTGRTTAQPGRWCVR